MNVKNQNIPRPVYTQHVMDLINKKMMIILVGQRRVGKSYILLQIKDIIEETDPIANVIYINKEWQRFSDIGKSEDLYKYVDNLIDQNKNNYLFIDEVQDIEDYQIALRSLYSEDKCQIIATGSNAKIFSSEISSKLGGRYLEVPIYPLSYKEFLIFHNLEDTDDSLLKFIRVGGLPGLALFDIENERQIRDYLQGVFSTIIMKDVILREQIRNVTYLENLTTFIADNIGKLFSIKKVTNTMISQGEKISDILTNNYVKYLKQSLLIQPLSRYDIHGKKIFEQIQKYYFTDNGLRNFLLGFNIRSSIEKIIENIVYNQLLIEGYKVFVGSLRNTEIDFIAEKNNQKIYIQCTYILGSQETIQREFGNLQAINDNYPKFVVSMEPIAGELADYPGIQHFRLRDFLTRF